MWVKFLVVDLVEGYLINLSSSGIVSYQKGLEMVRSNLKKSISCYENFEYTSRIRHQIERAREKSKNKKLDKPARRFMAKLENPSHPQSHLNHQESISSVKVLTGN